MAASNQVKQLSASWGYPIDATSPSRSSSNLPRRDSPFSIVPATVLAWVGPDLSSLATIPMSPIVGGTTLSTCQQRLGIGNCLELGIYRTAERLESARYWGSSGGISTTYSIPSLADERQHDRQPGFHHLPQCSGCRADGGQRLCRLRRRQSGNLRRHQRRDAVVGGFHGPGQPAGRRQWPAAARLPQPHHLRARPGTELSNSLFHDITTGNNFWRGSPNRFPAVPGYDLCTGWGTPNGTNLITALAGAPVIPVSPPPPPYGSTLSVFNGSNPNGAWQLFVQDDTPLDSGTNYDGWILNLTLASPVIGAADNRIVDDRSGHERSVRQQHRLHPLGHQLRALRLHQRVGDGHPACPASPLVSASATQGSVINGTLMERRLARHQPGRDPHLDRASPRSSGSFRQLRPRQRVHTGSQSG